MKILLVDDAVFVRMSLKKILDDSDLDCTYFEAGTGEEAVKLYTATNPDVVIMDITMPGMNGIEAVERIKELNPGAKIIMCSSMGYQDKVVDAINAGAADFIIKPYNADKVINSIKRVMNVS